MQYAALKYLPNKIISKIEGSKTFNDLKKSNEPPYILTPYDVPMGKDRV